MIGLVKEFIEFWSGVWANLPEIFSFLVRHYNDVVCVLILLSILIAEFVLFRKVYRKTEFQMEELKKIKKIGARLVVFKIIAFVAAAFFAIGPIEVIFESEAAIAFVSCLPPIILLPRLQKTILPYLYWRKAYKKEIGQQNIDVFFLCELIETLHNGHLWKELDKITKYDMIEKYWEAKDKEESERCRKVMDDLFGE